jgi:PAS domain S-box-containing protein
MTPAEMEALKSRLAELEALESERARVQKALQDSEERYRALYEENPSMYFTVDPEGIVRSVNPFGARQLGYEVAELEGQPVLNVFHPEDRDKVREQLEACLRQPRKVLDWEFRKIRKDGAVMWVREMARAVRNAQGNAVVLIVCEDITGRRRVEEELKQAHDEMEQRVRERTAALRDSEAALRRSQDELRALAGRLLTAQEDERRRLAREMHDDLTQRLAALAMRCGKIAAGSTAKSSTVQEEMSAVCRELQDLSSDAQAFSRRLHPAILEDLGLVDALQASVDAFTAATGIPATLRTRGVPEDLPKELALPLYRIAQEALRNVEKHASAPSATISLLALEGELTLSIEDTGGGFDRAAVRGGGGLGLASMEERARLIGAEFIVDARPGDGTVIEVRVPLSEGA